MLDRTDFSLWQQRIRLYCWRKENGANILKSIYKGPFQMGTVRETLAEGTEGAPYLGPERPRVYSDLSPEEKDRYNADIQATNILLQGLPKDIYTLINHYTNAKEYRKMRRCSWKNKGEIIHDFYVWFAKLINDIRNIKMTMSRMQLNSKFVNNMLPEWGRFVTAAKLNRGLRDSNYDQLYAYLKQHKAHANENKMMFDRFTQHTVDPLALMSNVSHQQHYLHSSSTLPSIYVPPHLADNAHLDSVQNVKGQQNKGQGTNPQGGGAVGYGGAQNRVRNVNTGQARQIKCYNCNGLRHIARNYTQLKHSQNFDYFKDKMLLMHAQENRVELDEEQLLFLAGGQDNAIDEDVNEQPVQDLALNVVNVFQADDYPVYDKVGPSYDLEILSKYVKDNAVPGVHSNVSSVPNNAYMIIYNDMYEPHAQSVSKTSRNIVVDVSLKILSRTRNGPYKPTTVVVQAVAATDDSPVIPEHTIVKTPMNMSPTNKAYFESEKEAIHLILTGIGDEIYSTVDACQTAQEIQNGQELYDWLADTDKEIDEQELEAHYSYMAKIQKVPTANTCNDSEQLEKELKECKTILAETSKTLEESNSVRDSCLVALQNKQTEFEKFNDDVSFEEELVHQRLRKTLTHVLELSSCIYLDDRAWEVLNFDSAGM
nr:integrase, catalytic region, zinc finger, CCHC-type, peptidase aspartic, catalytic [Tanacetum cinerariifolium]